MQAGLEADDQQSEQRADACAYHAASNAESAASAREEAVAGQQDGARDHRDPGVDTEGYAEDLEEEQDDGGHQGRREDRPSLSERLLQCVDGMCVVFDGIPQSPSMEVCQPIDECRAKNGENEPRIFQMPYRCCDDSGGHDGARDHAFAVDHPERIAVSLDASCTAAFIRGHLAASQSNGPGTRQASHLMRWPSLSHLPPLGRT